MKRLLVTSLLLAVGFASPAKAEPEWVKYRSFIMVGTHYWDDYLDKDNLLLTKDGITIYAEKRHDDLYHKNSENFKKATWKGINCETRRMETETGNKTEFTGVIPNTDKMSKREIEESSLDIKLLWKIYKLVCRGKTPTYIDLNSKDILDSQHPYKEMIYLRDLNKLGLTYNQYQSAVIQHERSKRNFKWEKTMRGNKKIGFWPVEDKWNQLYLPAGPIIEPKDNIDINIKSHAYKIHILRNTPTLENYTQKEIDKLRKDCIEYTDIYWRPTDREESIQKCKDKYPVAKKQTSNMSNTKSAEKKNQSNLFQRILNNNSSQSTESKQNPRDICLKAADYAGCMRYEEGEK